MYFHAIILVFFTVASGTSAAAPSSCTPTPVAPNPSRCGEQGTVPTEEALISSFKSCTHDYVGCYETCKTTNGCKSFSYKPKSNTCAIFNAITQAQGLQPSTTSKKFFWNLKACFEPAPCQYSCTTDTNPTGCGNQGIEWALYENDQGPKTGQFYSDFSPEHFKNKTPVYQSTFTGIGGFNYNRKTSSQISIYNSGLRTFSSNLLVLNHRFYFLAPYTSAFTITFFTSDDLVLFWLRENAYSGWSRANDEVDCGSDTCSTFNVQMTIGNYYPFRIIYAQVTGKAGFTVRIVDSYQNLVLDSSIKDSPNLVRFSCDGGTAPMFEPFGFER